MANCGFQLTSVLEERGIGLLLPSFLGSERTQLSAREVTETKRVAEARIHIECAVERIKEFKILQGEVDISVLHVIKQTFHVCAFLTNFQHPIILDVVYMS